MDESLVHDTAIVDKGAKVGKNTKIWHWVHICKGAVIGDNCSFGQSVYCPRSYRNREFIATFKILVSSDGQAKSIETLYIRKSDDSDMETFLQNMLQNGFY